MSAPATLAARLVAHRGDRARYPENTLEALAAALEAGARYLEFDVQLCADGVPVLLHDPTLERTAGVAGDVRLMSVEQVERIAVGEPRRFGSRFAGVIAPRLAAAVELLNRHGKATAFVELKRHSLEHFGLEPVVAAVAAAMAGARFPWVLISFAEQAVAAARERGWRDGWVLRDMEPGTRERALALAPEFLFVSAECLAPAPEPLWPGPWRWVVYDVNAPELARALLGRGAALLETDDLLALAGEGRDA